MTTQLQLDKMTRDELESCIGDLEQEARELRAASERQKQRLTEAADLMAELGRIHNTPHAKYQFSTGN